MGKLSVLSPGLLTTIQDLGRPGYTDLGISPCGAADSVALRIGNALLGNPPGAAALELTLVGPSLRFEAAGDFVLIGANLGAILDGNPIPTGEVVTAKAGQIFKTAAAREGCRTYFCIRGGFQVPMVLGSASTHLDSRIGGLEGRRLQAGDELEFDRHGKRKKPARRRTLTPALIDLLKIQRTLRVTDAIHTARFSPEAITGFYSAEYRISEQSNRLGLRLEGPALKTPGEVLTTGVCLGTVQIAQSGQPILLFVDQQTTGGYPQIACVASVDHFRIGQLRPGDRIRFQRISFEEARQLYLDQEALLDELVAR